MRSSSSMQEGEDPFVERDDPLLLHHFLEERTEDVHEENEDAKG